jgi:hypothetical protein
VRGLRPDDRGFYLALVLSAGYLDAMIQKPLDAMVAEKLISGTVDASKYIDLSFFLPKPRAR